MYKPATAIKLNGNKTQMDRFLLLEQEVALNYGIEIAATKKGDTTSKEFKKIKLAAEIELSELIKAMTKKEVKKK